MVKQKKAVRYLMKRWRQHAYQTVYFILIVKSNKFMYICI